MTTAVAPTSASAVLSELLEASRNIPGKANENESIRLMLGELAARAAQIRENVIGKSSQLGVEINDAKAHYLLAPSGVNAEDLAAEIQDIEFKRESGHKSSLSIRGVNGFHGFRQDDNILASIEDAVKESAREFEQFLEQNITTDWKARKEEICKAFGIDGSQTATRATNGSTGPGATIGFAGPSHTTSSSHGTLSVSGEKLSSGSLYNSRALGKWVLSPFGVGAGESLVATPAPITGQSAFVSQAQRHRNAEVVSMLNIARHEESFFSLCDAFGQIVHANTGNDSQRRQVGDAWDILMFITAEHVGRESPDKSLQRCFANEYLGNKPSMRKGIVIGSLEFLQHQYKNMIDAEIMANRQSANLGGVPSTISKIRAYLTLKFAQSPVANIEIVNDIPIWAVLFHLIRIGNWNEALQFTIDNEVIFSKVHKWFLTYLQTYVDCINGHMPSEILERIHAEFNQYFRFSTDIDPYKFAIYKILGRCEVSKRNFPPAVAETSEDWMWLHLMLCKEVEDAATLSPFYEKYSLVDLRRNVLKIGPSAFSSEDDGISVIYFQALLVVGLFEHAVDYLYSYFSSDAVHFAIALSYYGLLRVDNTVNEFPETLLTISDEPPAVKVPHINFAKLIGSYVHEHHYTQPEDAVAYLSLICLNSDIKDGDRQLKLCWEALREMTLETRNFSALLGNFSLEGTRSAGIIEKSARLIGLNSTQDFLDTIIRSAAVEADRDGLLEDSILLFQLSEKHDTVVHLVNKVLGDAIASVSLGSALQNDVNRFKKEVNSGAELISEFRANPFLAAETLMNIYSQTPAILDKVSPRNLETYQALHSVGMGINAFAGGDYATALDYVDKSNVLSIRPKDDIGLVRRTAQMFGALDESIAKNVPQLLVMVMECCARISAELSSSNFNNRARESILEAIAARTRNCMVYAGIIQYRIPMESYNVLTTLELRILHGN